MFTGADREAELADLFDGRRQLIDYQMMDEGPDEYCDGCSSFVDNIGHLAHLNARDTTFVVVSDMPAEQVYRTYFTHARGVNRLRPDLNLLDLTAYGRQEEWEDSPPGWPQDPTMSWMRHHDEY